MLVVSSKSGGTVETDSQRRTFEKAFRDAGIDPARRIVVVTDPGSPLEKTAADEGYRAVFSADPHVGGRYSALTAFGLVPSGLAGADVTRLLDEAGEVADLVSADDEGNPALVLGAALGGTDPLRDKIVFADLGSGIVGFADWAEQLIAESTGKDGTGLLPVVTEGADAPEVASAADDVLVVRLVSQADAARALDADDDGAPAEPAATGEGVSVAGPLGAQFLLWEYAVAVAGRLLGINPFDQPDVESAKAAARGLLDRQPQPTPPDLVDGVVEIRATPGLLGGARTLDDAVDALLAHRRAAGLPGGHGLPGPRARRRPGRGPGAARPPARPARDLRVGAPVPALDRPVPQGRARRPAATCRSRPTARRTWRCRTGRSRSGS